MGGSAASVDKIELSTAAVASVKRVTQRYGKAIALD